MTPHIRTVGEEAARIRPGAPAARQWQPVLGPKLDDHGHLQHGKPRRHHLKRVRASLACHAERAFEIVDLTHHNGMHLDAEYSCRALGFETFVVRVIRIQINAADVRRRLLEELHAFGCKLIHQQGSTGSIAARPGQACDMSKLYWIGAADKHERDRLRRLHEVPVDVPA
jgi:hypothetical protein